MSEKSIDRVRTEYLSERPSKIHSDFSTGKEQAIQIVIWEMPARARERNLISEERTGRTFHLLEGKVPHSDLTPSVMAAIVRIRNQRISSTARG